MSEKRLMVTAIFRNRLDAEQAFDYLHGIGYRDSEINLLMSDKSNGTFSPLRGEAERYGTTGHVAEGAGVGGAIGTVVGATAAGLAAIGTSLVLPGLGLIVAGPIAAAFAGAGAGAVTGGVVGALVGAGMNDPNVEAIQAALREGGVVVGVVPQSSDDVLPIEKKFKELNGESVCYC